MKLDQYVGIPHTKLNCYQLVSRVLFEQKGIVLPNFDYGLYPLSHRKLTEKIELSNCEPVVSPTTFDIVVFLFGHVGVYVSPGKVLHVQSGGVSVIEPIGLIKSQVVGYYRV